LRKAEVFLEYQPLIHEPPVQPEALFQSAAVNDKATIDYWRHVWLGNITANKQYFGEFARYSAGQEFGKHQYGSAIIAGSGPSLKINAHELKNRGKIPLVSCLHNFHYFEDLDLAPEYYVTLDASPTIVAEEVTEGGKRPVDEYWEITKDRTLIASIVTAPEVLKKWKGKILFYSSIFPEEKLMKDIDAIERFNLLFTTGGNVLGSCLSMAKLILGAWSIIFVGADFSFGYDKKFHSWDSKYDKALGYTLRVTDIYGNKVHTWASYYGFKKYFDSTSIRVPGNWYNCSEGGCLGAYDQGNISTFSYLNLKDCLSNLNVNNQLKDYMVDPKIEKKLLLYP